jgi:hypothetical protein
VGELPAVIGAVNGAAATLRCLEGAYRGGAPPFTPIEAADLKRKLAAVAAHLTGAARRAAGAGGARGRGTDGDLGASRFLRDGTGSGGGGAEEWGAGAYSFSGAAYAPAPAPAAQPQRLQAAPISANLSRDPRIASARSSHLFGVDAPEFSDYGAPPPNAGGGGAGFPPPNAGGGGGSFAPPNAGGGGGSYAPPNAGGWGGPFAPPNAGGGGGSFAPPNAGGWGGPFAPPNAGGGGGSFAPLDAGDEGAFYPPPNAGGGGGGFYERVGSQRLPPGGRRFG